MTGRGKPTTDPETPNQYSRVCLTDTVKSGKTLYIKNVAFCRTAPFSAIKDTTLTRKPAGPLSEKIASKMTADPQILRHLCAIIISYTPKNVKRHILWRKSQRTQGKTGWRPGRKKPSFFTVAAVSFGVFFLCAKGKSFLQSKISHFPQAPVFLAFFDILHTVFSAAQQTVNFIYHSFYTFTASGAQGLRITGKAILANCTKINVFFLHMCNFHKNQKIGRFSALFLP